MTPPLFLLDDIPPGLRAGGEFHLTGDEGHHAARARRVRAGEQVLVGDGAGVLLRCVVRRVVGDGVHLDVHEREFVSAAQPRLTVVQALPKGDRGELAVQTLTELGVEAIVPWAAERCVTQWTGARGEKVLTRWRRISREAAKQSRRPLFAQVHELASTKSVAGLLADADAGFVLHQDADAALAVAALPLVGDVVVVVGPEGGVSDDELELFASAGATAVRLGDTVLRTSTAGPAALAALSLRLGRWNSPIG